MRQSYPAFNFKQGDRSYLNNYRPISVIPVVANVFASSFVANGFASCIYDQIYDYLIANNMITSHQSGFHSLYSENWAYKIDRGSVNAVVSLDLKKALDTVDQSILLSKLFEYGCIDRTRLVSILSTKS